MKLGKAGLTALGITAVITFSGIVFTGTDALDQARENINQLKNAIIRLTDEGANNVENANGIIANKNDLLLQLQTELEKANEEIKKGDKEIERGNEEIKRLEGEVNKANEESEKFSVEVKAISDKHKNNEIIPSIEDNIDNDVYKVLGQELEIGIYRALDTENTQTIRVSNPNSESVKINVTGETEGRTVEAGDAIYLVRSNNEKLTITYTLSSGEVVSVTK